VLAPQNTTLGRRRNPGLPRNHVNLVVVALAIVCAGTAVPQTPVATLLLVIAVAGEAFTVQFRSVRISGSFAALVLAMALLGPVPAAAIGVVSVVFDNILTRRAWRELVWNASTFGVFGLLGGWMLTLVGREDPIAFASSVVLVYLVTNALNFGSVAAYLRLTDTLGMREAYTTVYRTMLPFELATALLTAGVVFAYDRVGLAAIALLVVVLFVFHHLVRTGVKAFERGEELTRRGDELGALQIGVLSTVLQTLSMRDAMTARHSAAVARYSREVARLLGCDEREQDLIHTAALLHDIGKFILPDNVLFAKRGLTDEEWELIKLHPEQGAKLVERIEGYGPVAEIVRHHHEKYAGGGYPAGIAGDAIPLGARIIAVADTYDVMTSRDSYRRPVSIEAALEEIRRVSGTQLDPVVATAFERMILEGGVAFSHADQADFESELDTRSIKRRPVADDDQGELHSLAPRGNAVVRGEVDRP
jgi:putative nucleotidyltransferase with HDIG domain